MTPKFSYLASPIRPQRQREIAALIFRWSFAGIIVLLSLACLIVALVFRNPAMPTVDGGQPEDLLRLETDLGHASKARANLVQPVLAIDEAEVNSYIRSRLAFSSKSETYPAATVLQDLKVKLDGDLVTLYAILTVRGKEMTFAVEGRLRSRDGYAEFDPTSAKIGALSIPHFMLDSAMKRLSGSAQMRENMRLPRDVSEIVTQGSRIALSLK